MTLLETQTPFQQNTVKPPTYLQGNKTKPNCIKPAPHWTGTSPLPSRHGKKNCRRSQNFGIFVFIPSLLADFTAPRNNKGAAAGPGTLLGLGASSSSVATVTTSSGTDITTGLDRDTHAAAGMIGAAHVRVPVRLDTRNTVPVGTRSGGWTNTGSDIVGLSWGWRMGTMHLDNDSHGLLCRFHDEVVLVETVGIRVEGLGQQLGCGVEWDWTVDVWGWHLSHGQRAGVDGSAWGEVARLVRSWDLGPLDSGRHVGESLLWCEFPPLTRGKGERALLWHLWRLAPVAHWYWLGLISGLNLRGLVRKSSAEERLRSLLLECLMLLRSLYLTSEAWHCSMWEAGRKLSTMWVWVHGCR